VPEVLLENGAAGTRGLVRAWFDRLEVAVATSSLGAASALAAVAAVGRVRAALSGRWPSAGEVAALYGTGRIESRRISLGIAANEARNRLVLRRTSGRPLAPFAPRVRFEKEAAAAELQAPLVLVTAHVGALYLLAAGLDRLWTQRLALRWSALHQTAPGEDSAFTSGGVVARTEALRRGLESLRQGKVVVTALEGPHGSADPGRLLGRRLDLGRGGFALARLAGVRIAPVAALWERNRVQISLGMPVETTADAAGEVALWFEALLRRSPRQMSLGLLRQLLQSPALEPPGEDASGV
jgi:hypothetical protein